MRELRITAVELQGMIAPLLRTRLRKAGFTMGASSAEDPPTFMFPINLDVAGAVIVIREDGGTWMFQQEEDPMLYDRLQDSLLAHGEACCNRASRPG